jgi:hypothetical protein
LDLKSKGKCDREEQESEGKQLKHERKEQEKQECKRENQANAIKVVHRGQVINIIITNFIKFTV